MKMVTLAFEWLIMTKALPKQHLNLSRGRNMVFWQVDVVNISCVAGPSLVDRGLFQEPRPELRARPTDTIAQRTLLIDMSW